MSSTGRALKAFRRLWTQSEIDLFVIFSCCSQLADILIHSVSKACLGKISTYANPYETLPVFVAFTGYGHDVSNHGGPTRNESRKLSRRPGFRDFAKAQRELP